MEKIKKIIDSLSPVEQLIMCNALQKKLNRGPEYTIRKNGTGYSIKPNDKYENASHGTVCNLAFETPEMARGCFLSLEHRGTLRTERTLREGMVP